MTHDHTSVRRVRDNTGSHIEPPFNPAWSDEDKLRWHAAVTTFDTGLTIRVGPAGYSINGVPQHGYYSIQVGWSSCGPLDLDSGWTYINGIAAGARAASEHRAKP
jgi:hypothetical protein